MPLAAGRMTALSFPYCRAVQSSIMPSKACLELSVTSVGGDDKPSGERKLRLLLVMWKSDGF
jgi:hypothetical protein